MDIVRWHKKLHYFHFGTCGFLILCDVTLPHLKSEKLLEKNIFHPTESCGSDTYNLLLLSLDPFALLDLCAFGQIRPDDKGY